MYQIMVTLFSTIFDSTIFQCNWEHKKSLKLEIYPISRYKVSVDLNKMTFVYFFFQCFYKNNEEAFIGFTVCKIYFNIVSFSKWLWELCSYPTGLLSQSSFRFWPAALFKINHFNSETYWGNLFLFWFSVTVCK